MRLLTRALAFLVVLIALPALAQTQTGNVVYWTTPPTVGTSCGNYPAPVLDRATGSAYCCNLSTHLWVSCGGGGNATPGGSTGQMQWNNSGTLGGAPGLAISGSGYLLASKLGLWTQDTDGDGTPDVYVLGDRDHDGTLDFAKDVTSFLNPIIAARTPTLDYDGDGTADGIGLLIHLLPGRWRAGYHDQLTIGIGGVTFEGSGRDETLIDYSSAPLASQGTACPGGGTITSNDINGDGTCDYLDNLDGIQDYFQTFYFSASNIQFRDFSVDLHVYQWVSSNTKSPDPSRDGQCPGSTMTDAINAGFCDPNDADGDGVGNITDCCPCDPTVTTSHAVGTMSGCGSCATACSAGLATYFTNAATMTGTQRSCPIDETWVFQEGFGTNAHKRKGRLLFENLGLYNCDSNCFEMNDPYERVTMDRLKIVGSGEQAVQLQGHATLTNSEFDNCSAQGNLECVTVSPGDDDMNAGTNLTTADSSYDVVITGNRFKDCGGSCVALYGATVGSGITGAYGLNNVNVSNNTFDNRGTPSSAPAIRVNGEDAGSSWAYNNYLIANNTILAGHLESSAISVGRVGTGTGWFTNFNISHNTIVTDTPFYTTAPTCNSLTYNYIGNGIFVSSMRDSLIDANTIDYYSSPPDGGGQEESGIRVSGSDHVKVTGNHVVPRHVSNSASIGIDLYSSSSYNTVEGNTLDMQNTGTGGDYGVKVEYSCSANQIRGNFIDFNLVGYAYGIALGGTGCNYNKLTDNMVVNTGNPYQAFSGSGTGNMIHDNFAYNCTGGGNAFLDDNTTPSPNLWTSNWAIKCAAGGASKGSNAYENGTVLGPASGHGYGMIVDESNAGTLDSTSYLYLFSKTKLAFEGNTNNAFITGLGVQDPTANSWSLLAAHDGVVESTQFETTGDATVQNTTSAQTMIGALCSGCSVTVPANQLLAGAHLRVTFAGYYLQDTAATLTFTVSLGGTALCSFPALTTSAAAGGSERLIGGRCDAVVRTAGSGGVLIAGGTAVVFTSATALNPGAYVNPSNISINLANADDVAVTGQWSAASANNKLVAQRVTAEWVH